ncbi:DUF6338 family protein [Nocardia farcinica]|uniref:DUF6338 family protein n=1 Tax=Nocardia farcinica TaxID=37329 RepID=UPI0018931C17|nr:DUF6338 family protein [Nocardia farcinica]MBF6522820.1 hypothetical protein [Nocardia farcinica]
MTPSTWLTLIAFFYFIAPGLLYDRLTAHKTAKRRESAFTEVSRVALVSTLCSAGGFLLIWGFAGICAWQDWKLLPDPSAMIKQGSVYFADNFLKVLITAAVLFVLSLAISYGAVLLIHRNTEGDIDFQSAPGGGSCCWTARSRKDDHHVRARHHEGRLGLGRPRGLLLPRHGVRRP